MEGEARMSVLTHFSLFPLALSGSEKNLITNSRQVRLATGLFPVVSLLNHSCSPNTSVSFISTIATVRASQQIKKGQEILHCYGESSVLPPVRLSPAEKDRVNSPEQATGQVPHLCRVCTLAEAVHTYGEEKPC